MAKSLGVLKITKEMFVKTFEMIETQYRLDEKCCDAFRILLPNDYVSGYYNDILYKTILDILKQGFSDNNKDSWIDYYIYDLDFGKKYKAGCITDKDGNDITLNNHNDLWNLLNNVTI